MSDPITTAEARDILGVASVSTVTRMVVRGELKPAAKLANGQLLFNTADVEALAEKRKEGKA